MKCSLHYRYVGRTKPKNSCETCFNIWEWSRFATWALNNKILPDNLSDDYFLIGVRNHLAMIRLLSSLERDMYG